MKIEEELMTAKLWNATVTIKGQPPVELRLVPFGVIDALSDHFEVRARTAGVTSAEIIGGPTPTKRQHPRQHSEHSCIHGHPWTPENTYRDGHGYPACRDCRTESRRKSAAAKAAAQ